MHGMIMKIFRGMASRHLFRSTSGPHFGMLKVVAAFAVMSHWALFSVPVE